MGNVFLHTGKTFTADEQKERAAKALKLNGLDYIPTTLFPISPPIGSEAEPTIKIKRPKPDLLIKGLKGASAIQAQIKIEKEKAEKALKLDSLIS